MYVLLSAKCIHVILAAALYCATTKIKNKNQLVNLTLETH